MSIFETILKTGVEDNTDPEQIVAALDAAHNDISANIRTGAKDKESAFRALIKLDDDHYSAIAQIKAAVTATETARVFPDPIERATFMDTIANLRMEQGAAYKTPDQYKAQIDEINSKVDKLARPQRFFGGIEFGGNRIASFAARSNGPQNYDFLVTGKNGEKDVTNVQINRDEMVAAAVKEQADLESGMRDKLSRNRDGSVDSSALNQPLNSERLKYLSTKINFLKTAPEHDLARFKLVDQLRSNEQFKKVIPENWIEQYTTRPLLSLTKGLASVGAAVGSITGDPGQLSQDIIQYGDAGVDVATPGQARNRFEAGDKAPIADLVSQGVESLATVLLPGGVAKIGSKVLPLMGNFGKTIAIGNEMSGFGGASSAGVSTLNAYSGFAATSFGNSYAQRMNFADTLSDPVEAERVRAWAPLLAVADATKEVITERLLPGDVERTLLQGVKGTIGQRLFKAGVVAPTMEGLEEVAGNALESLYSETPGSQKPQDPIEAFKGGFFGGLSATPVLLATKDGLGKKPNLVVDKQAVPGESPAETQPAKNPVTVVRFGGQDLSANSGETKILNAFADVGVTTREDVEKIAEAPAETPEQEAMKADAQIAVGAFKRRDVGKSTLTALASITGAKVPQAATESIIDGTFNGDFRGPGSSTLDIDENGNVVLRRFASGYQHMVKLGQSSSGHEDLWNTSESHGGGNGVPTIGSARDVAGVPEGSYPGYDYEGTFRIPVEDFLREAEAGNIILGNIGETEIVVSPDVAQKYLTEVTNRVTGESVPLPQKETPAPLPEGGIPSTDQQGANVPAGATFAPTPEGIAPAPAADGLTDNQQQNNAEVNKIIPPDEVKNDPAPVISNPSEIPVVDPPESAVAMADEIAKIAPGIQFHPVDDTTEAGQALKLFEQATGKRVALFTTSGPALDGSTTDGFALRDDPNTIFMAANTVQPFLHVLGHETLHTLEQMPGYQQFAGELRAVEPEAWDKARKLFPNDEAQAQREFTADVVGTRFADKGFWDKLEKRLNPGTFKNFVSFVAKTWERIKGTISPRALNIKNVAAVDRMIQDFLIKTGTVQPGTPQQKQASAQIVEPGTTVTGTQAAAEPATTPPVDTAQFTGNRVYTADEFRKAVESFGPQVQASRVSTTMEEVPLSQFRFGQENDAYLYHITTTDRLDSIVYEGEGLIPGKGGQFGGVAAQINSRGKIFLTERSGVAVWAGQLEEQLSSSRDYEEEQNVEDDIAVIRVPRNLVVDIQDDDPSNPPVEKGRDFFTTKPVPAAPPDIQASSIRQSDIRSKILNGHMLTKEEYEKVVSELERLPREVFYAGNTEIIRNATGTDQRRMDAEEISKYGRDPVGDPYTRFTHDKFGNRWIWKSSAGMHFGIEPAIRAKEGVDVNQNFSIPTHRELVKEAILAGVYVPENVIAEYPNYADFVKPSARVQTSSVTPEPFNAAKAAAVHTVGGAFLESGTVAYPEWSARVIGTLGEGARQYLRPAYESLRYSGLSQVPTMTAASVIDNPTRQPNPAPGLTATEQDALSNGATGIKNAVTDELRKSLGVEAALEMEVEHHTDVLDEALARNRADSGYSDRLISELIETPRQVDQYEEATLMLANLRVQRDVENAVNALASAQDEVARGEALATLGEARAKAQALMDIEKYAGTLWGRTGNFRRRMLARDYSLVRMEYNLRAAANRGAALTPDQAKQVTDAHAEIKKAGDEVAAAEEKDLDARVQEYLDAFFKKQAENRAQFTPDMKPAQKKAKIASAAEQARTRLRSKLAPVIELSRVQRSSPSLDPSVMADLVTVGISYIEDKLITPEKFRERLSQDFGGQFDSYADTIFNAALEEHAAITGGTAVAKTTGAKKGVTRAVLDAAVETAKTTGDVLPDRQLVRMMVKFQVEQGTRGSKNVVDAVHAELQPVFPALTKRQLKEIFTDYGKSVFPSKEEVATELRLLRRVLSLEVTIERLQNNLPALKTGLQRDKANKEIRDLTRQANELKRKLGLTQKTPEQLAGALTAAKTRLKNEIEDLNTFIAQGGRRPEQRTTRTPARSDEELKQLTKSRDELKKQLVELEGKTPLTEEQRVALTIKSLERAEENLTRRVETGEFVRKKEQTPQVTNDEIEERRSYLQTLRNIIKEGADAQKIYETPVFRALDAAQKRLDYYLGVLDGSIAPGTREQTQRVMSQKEEDIRLQVAAIQQVLAEEKKAANQKPESERRVESLKKRLAAVEEIYDTFLKTGVFPVTPDPAPKTPEEEAIQLQIDVTLRLISNEKKAEGLRKKIEQFDRVLQGLEEPPKKSVKARFIPQEIEDLQLELAAMQQVLAEEERAARRTPEALRRVEAATRERDRLERVMAGLEEERKAAPREFLSQAEEDLVLEIQAMRQALAEERRKPGKTKAEKQLKSAQDALERIEAILDGSKLPKVPTPTEVLTEEEREIREQLLTAKMELAAVRREDPDRKLKADKAAIDRRIGDLEAKIAAKDFAPKPKKERPTDKELAAKKLAYENLRAKWENMLFAESLKSRSLYKKVIDFFRQGFLTARLLELGMDFGIVLRQAGRVIGRPLTVIKATKMGFTSVTEDGERRMREEQQKNPMLPVWREAGLEITDWDNPSSVTKQEEIWASRWLQKWEVSPSDRGAVKATKGVINAVTGPVRGLGRGQVTMINEVRIRMMEAMSQTLSRFGAPTMEELRHYATMINVSTGRGTMNDMEKSASGILSVVFLAYRWAKSGLQYTTLHPLWYPVISGNATLRSTAVVAAEYARSLSGIALVYTLYAMAAAGADDPDKFKIEWDPRSKKFGKLKFGESYVDPTAGISQWATLLTKLGNEAIYKVFGVDTGFRGKKAQSGRLTPLGEGPDGKPLFGSGIGSEITDFLRTKLNPIVGAGANVITGRDPVGEKTDLNKEAGRLFTPLIFKDVSSAIQQNGLPTGAAVSILAFFGVAVQTWEEKRKEPISSQSRQWLYDVALSVPALKEDATVGDVRGFDKEVSVAKGLDRVLSEDERKALLKKSLPAVETAIKEARDTYGKLPEDPVKRENQIKQIQSRLGSRVENARRKVILGQ